MRTGFGGTGGNGGSDDDTDMSDFLNPEADSLMAKVNVVGMVRNFARSTVLAFFTGASGVVLAFERNITGFITGFVGGYEEMFRAVVDAPGSVFTGVFRNAEAELAQFDLLATPVAVLVLLSVAITIVFMVDLWFGGDG